MQYSHSYYNRLIDTKNRIKTQASIKFNQVKILKNLTELKANERVVIIGTIYKDMSLKPSVMHPQSLTSLGILKHLEGKIYSDSDSLILEDDSGRIKIAKNEVIDPARFLTGSVVALLGKINTNGIFDTEDFTYATYPDFDRSMDMD